MNATGLLASSSSLCAASRNRSRTQTDRAIPRKSAASLKACFSTAYNRSSRYSSLTPLGGFAGFRCFIYPTLYGRGTDSQAKILCLTLPGSVRTLYDMENKTLITDGITAGIEPRKQRGLEIAALARIDKMDGILSRHKRIRVRRNTGFARALRHIPDLHLPRP